MKKTTLLFTALFALFARSDDAVSYVLPLMGTDNTRELSTGNLYPCIALPQGMNAWSPMTGKIGDGWFYTYQAKKINGIRQIHQPSPWIRDYGAFAFLPVVGKKAFTIEDRASWFSHKAESVAPDYYRVYLADWDTSVELTPSERAACLNIIYPATDSPYFVLDAFNQGSSVEVLKDKGIIRGWCSNNTGGVAKNFRNYFVLKFDRPFAEAEVWSDKEIVSGKTSLQGEHVGAIVKFAQCKRGEKVSAKVASSFISFEQADRNLQEVEGKSFEECRAVAHNAWKQKLDVFDVQSDNIDQLRVFRTCLYRSLLFPRIFHEVAADGGIVHWSPHTGEILPGAYYTDTGFWDTFRALFPMHTLFPLSDLPAMRQWLANCWKESGWLPEWSSPGLRNCMIGNNSASVALELLQDAPNAPQAEDIWQAVVHGAENAHPKITSVGRAGAKEYIELGYVPRDIGLNESAARTLEYAYDDWCVWKLGTLLGKPASETDRFLKRSGNWRNLFDPRHGLMVGRNKDGSFDENFNPVKWGGDFTEGNSLQYSFSVFTEVPALMDLMGGREAFAAKLDSVFSTPPTFDCSYYGSVIHEIREMQIMNFGQYAHGNQPAQHMIYLYNWAGQPHKTQYWVRETMDRLYTPSPDGYCGDEDNGQTSAWYVWSALGMYPVCPGSGEYALGAPLFPRATVRLASGKTLRIIADGVSSQKRYVKKLILDGKEWKNNFISRDKLLKDGATLVFEMCASTDMP